MIKKIRNVEQDDEMMAGCEIKEFCVTTDGPDDDCWIDVCGPFMDTPC